MEPYIKIADKLNDKKTTITHALLSYSSAAHKVRTLRAMLAFFLSHSNASLAQPRGRPNTLVI